jgi:hypothetical protein
MEDQEDRARTDNLFRESFYDRTAAIGYNERYIELLEDMAREPHAKIAEIKDGPVTVRPFSEMSRKEQILHCNTRHRFLMDKKAQTAANHASDHAAHVNDPDPVHIHRAGDSDDE